MTQWPGKPVAAWHPATPELPSTVPSGRGIPKLVNPIDAGRRSSCGNSFKRRTDGNLIAHQDKRREQQCEGSYDPPGRRPPSRMAPRQGRLPPHGLRHSHKTSLEDGIPEIPGMRGLYSHASQIPPKPKLPRPKRHQALPVSLPQLSWGALRPTSGGSGGSSPGQTQRATGKTIEDRRPRWPDSWS
jgi:hypothetical protein